MILRQDDPVGKLVDVDDIRDQIERVLEDVSVRGDHVIVNDHGKAVVAVVPFEFYKRKMARSRDEFFDTLEQMAETANLTEKEAETLAAEDVRCARSQR
jgi:antitoxin (DNA-binding transcriptional repressor) of toxin-antitoxin stability system